MRKKLLWVGDAGCPSGFANATHKILEGLDYHLDGEFDCTVLGINYRGDPHDYPYPIYAAAPGGDGFGVGRVVWMCDRVRPDVIILQNDGWNIQSYIKQIRAMNPDGTYTFPEHADIPVIAIVAVDGKNFRGHWLKGVAHAIFWTQFALDEARAGGYAGPASVIPLGVDIETYYPVDKLAARVRRFDGGAPNGIFIVGNINRNQPRKRWDLTVKYFAEWIKYFNPTNAYLFLHTAPTGDQGIDVRQLVKYYGVESRLILMEPPIHYGVSTDQLRDTYNTFDVQVSTTQGEGFGLTTFEGMACGVPQLVPDWSALGDLCIGAAHLVPCSSTAVGPPYINVIGGVVDEEAFVTGLNELYQSAKRREDFSRRGLERVNEARFRWSHVGACYRSLVTQLLDEVHEDAFKDLSREAAAL